MAANDLDALRNLTKNHPQMRWTHLYNPVTYTTPTPLREQMEAFVAAVKDGGHDGALEGVDFVADKIHLGEFHGAWGGVAVCAALTRRRAGEGWNGRRCALVEVHGEGDEHFYVALGEPTDAE